MTHYQIHSKIVNILERDMRVFNSPTSYTDHFYNDLALSTWELNWLLYNIEHHFNIRMENDLEHKLETINQLVSAVFTTLQKKKSTDIEYQAVLIEM
jgi:acyl carrier protein